MTIFIAYYALLVLWLLLLWPLVGLTGRARIWVGIVTAIGALAVGYELWAVFIWQPKWRLDILLIAPVLLLLYVSAGVTLFSARQRKTAGLLLLTVAGTAGVIAYDLISAYREADRAQANLQERNKLLFGAKFRDRETYKAYFGMADAHQEAHPVGHWEAVANTHFTRLIIKANGRTWLFYRCGDTECHFGPEGSGMQGPGDRPDIWNTVLEKHGVGRRSLEVTQDSPNRLSVRIDTQTAEFVTASPPVRSSPVRETITYLGAFSAFRCKRPKERVWVRQVWLWRQNGRLFAVSLFGFKVPGRRASFGSPVVMGEGRRMDGAWAFDWQQFGKSWSAHMSLTGGDVSLVLTRGGEEPVSLVLAPGPVVRDKVVELAPRTSGEDWRHWVDTVLARHFSEADIPAC